MNGIAPIIVALGLDGSWLPILVTLVVVPTLYIILAVDVHKEYGDLVLKATDTNYTATPKEGAIFLEKVNVELKIFNLEWWIVAAFGVLISAIIGASYMTDWSQMEDRFSPPTASIQTGSPPAVTGPYSATAGTYNCRIASGGAISCWPLRLEPGTGIRAAMSLYATFIGLVVGFKLGWARLKLAKDLKRYYLLRSSIWSDASLKECVMPPSGYTTKQTRNIEEFLRSCAEALQVEAQSSGLSLIAGLDKELNDISYYLDENKVSPTQRAALELTAAFYRRLRKKAPGDETAFVDAVSSSIRDVGSEILAMKVSPTIKMAG